MIGGHPNMQSCILKGHSIGKIENRCSRRKKKSKQAYVESWLIAQWSQWEGLGAAPCLGKKSPVTALGLIAVRCCLQGR